MALDELGIIALTQFYADVYLSCFPNEDERESFDNLTYYLEKATNATDYDYHIIVVKNENDTIIGGAIFDYFKTSKCAIIEYIAVKKDMQSKGVGTFLYKQILNILKGKKVKYIFCEVDDPEKALNNKHLQFWKKKGFRKVDIDYIQPKLSGFQHQVEMWLIVNSDKVQADTLKQVLKEYMKYCMKITQPEQNEEFIKMSSSIKSEIVNTTDILEKL